MFCRCFSRFRSSLSCKWFCSARILAHSINTLNNFCLARLMCFVSIFSVCIKILYTNAVCAANTTLLLLTFPVFVFLFRFTLSQLHVYEIVFVWLYSPEQWCVQITSVIASYSCCMVVYKTSRQTHISVCFFHFRYFNFVRFECIIYITSRSIYDRDV